ncbi:hypothetical protein [Dolichospermum compactum]|uniref:HEPN domain-containing protein n=1 Tax=Dolichospermum compactum NIES-806 TaxID=1973481 RepID=A0A1Z4V8F3_9CYAN|nr:hypothetical protein [Dolichospermum compactum]BAZ87817.1 hypothetical protein NIES806_40480 [Dolichospermum compactum NIES-806]
MSKSHILHIKQAELNEDAADIAAQSECYDWAVTMCFYAALHYVEGHAIFNSKDIYAEYYNIESNQHNRRIAYVHDVSYDKYGDMLRSAAYETLYKASMKARYMENIPCYSRKYFKLSFNRYFQELSIVKELVKI